MIQKSSVFNVLSILFLSYGLVQAQTGSRDAATSRSFRVLVAAHSSQNNLRFTALGIARAIRLEVFNQAGDRVFDSGQKDGSILDWRIGEGSESMLPNGLYGCLITVSELDGKQNQRRGAFWIEGRSARMESGLRMPADSANAQGPEDAVTLLQEEGLPIVQMLHDGTVGRIVTGRGGLSFSTGNLLADSDVELMRITPEGNVGIGVEEPVAKLDVAGLIRTSGGIQFPDGTILKSASAIGRFPIASYSREEVGLGGQSSYAGTMSNTRTNAAGPRRSSITADGEKSLASGSGIGHHNASEGSFSTFYGLNAGANNVRDDNVNSFFGGSAGYSNTTGNGNNFFGFKTGFANTTGINNAFFGLQTGYYNTTGSYNSFFGVQPGLSNTTGSWNSFFGMHAGQHNTTGNYNSFFGMLSGLSNTVEHNNIFIGFYSDGIAGITNATAIGTKAKVTQSNSLVLGGIKGINGATASTKVGIGTTAPTSLLTVAGDIEISGASGSFKIAGDRVLSVTESNNTFLGIGAGLANTTGSSNSYVGSNAGVSNTTGSGNTFVGEITGYYNTTGSYNSFVGRNAGHSNTTGSSNAFFGVNTGVSNTTGNSNSFVGANTGAYTTTGIANSLFGALAGFSNTTGHSNSFVGYNAGYFNTTGFRNSFVGDSTGLSNTVEDSNTFIGSLSDGTAGITNATAIGSKAKVAQSNSLVLGSINGINGATADTRVGIGTTAPQASLHVQNGGIYLSTPSEGVTLKSPDGKKCAKLSIDNSGALVTTLQACPGATPPAKATLISPTGNIQGNTPIYKWNAVSNSSWYQLWVNDSSNSSGKIKIWYTAEQVGCSSGIGTCSITPSTVLASGNAQWWIQTWNEFGYGDWSEAMSFSVP